jgi:PAS domain S-box-containing protein
MKVEHKIATAFLIAFAAVCLLGTLAYLDARSLLSRNVWVVHTYEVLRKIDRVFQDLRDTEGDGRWFLRAGKDADLQGFEAGATAFAADLDGLQRMTADNPLQDQNLREYRKLSSASLASLRQRIAARQASGVESPGDLGPQDRESMAQVRALTSRMIAEENQLLDRRTAASAQSAQLTLLTFGLLIAVAVLLLLVFYGFIRHDLEDRRRVAAALEESDRRFRGVMESAPDAMIISNPTGIISLSNTRASELFGYAREELAGQSLSTLLLERMAPSAEPLEEEVDAARVARESALLDLRARGAQLDGVRRDGGRFPIDFSQSPLEAGQEHLLITTVRDRTEQQRAEDAVRKFSLDLARSNAELERFAYVASHDLQEPLRMVSSYTQLLSRRYKGKLDANADEFIAYAVDGATRMQKLIGDLLTLSRVGTQAKPSEPVDTGAILQRVLSDMQSTIENVGAQIHYPEKMPTVLADGTQIGQLFQNIIGNGLKFHGEAAPRIEVTVTPENGDEGWRFAFKDNGIGIEPQYFERIFVIFQRLHGKERYAGTGIGLAICKKIVERHGGKLWVESKPGEGTTFLFTLPAVPIQV